MKKTFVALILSLSLLTPTAAWASGSKSEIINGWPDHSRPAAKVTDAPITGLLRRIGGCESSGRPDGPLRYTAQNPSSSASGAFQMLYKTWNGKKGKKNGWKHVYGKDVGAVKYMAAKHAPPNVQRVVAYRAFKAQGSRPWWPSRRCWG